jgi:hypothetical protein
MTDRIVQTTWTDGGRHQPLPPPEDPQGDEIERLTVRVAELERLVASLIWDAASGEMETLEHLSHVDRVRFARDCIEDQEWTNQRIQQLGAEWLAAFREAIESPDPRP